MQTPPRIKMHKSHRNNQWLCSLTSTIVVLLTILAHSNAWAWQYSDNQQVFPNRHPDFYHTPSNPGASNQYGINSQNLYNQPLNLPLQQQFLTPTSSNGGGQQPTTSSDQAMQPVDQSAGSEPFSALFAPNSRISSSAPSSEQQQHQHQTTVAAISDGPKSKHDEPAINERDTSQQQARPVDTTNSQIKSNDHQSGGKQDHDIVQSPSPLGKILDVVARETVSALSGSGLLASKESTAATTTTKDAKQPAPSLEGKVTHATKSESDSGKRANEQVVLHLKPLTQAMAAQKKKNSADKNAMNSIEQQIINQHARATSYATLHSRRYEPPTAAPAPPHQLVRLLPTKHRGDTKLFSNLLSTLSGGGGGGHNSASGGADSSSESAAGGHLTSLVDNFKSGISSRSSIVKAAISDNKLARTLSTVGKTIGGNKYVASAGAAAALAALGLTVSKFLSPYVMAGSYSKLGGAGPMEPLLTSGSYLQPSYMTSAGFVPGPDRNFHYLPPSSLGSGLSDSMLAAATNGNQQTGQYLEPQFENPSQVGQLHSAFNSYASQQAAGSSDLAGHSPASFYASYRPSGTTTGGSLAGAPHRSTTGASLSGQKGAFDAGANGHYSSFYSSQPDYEQQNGSGAGLDLSGLSGSGQPAQFGSYISGAPTAGGGEFSVSGYSPPASDHSAISPTSGGYQVDLGASSTYEPASASPGSQQYDQVMSSASSDTPTYANSPTPAIGRVSFPSKTATASSGGRYLAPQHRSGAVMLKLDEATRNLIRQQLQVELAAQAAPTNYNYLALNSARPQQPMAAARGVDQSSGEMTTSHLESAPVVSMTDQRAGAADSSGNYATFVQWQPQSSSFAQQQKQQQGSARSGTIESNYNGAQLAAGGQNNEAHPRQEHGQFVAGGGGGGGRANNKNTLPAYNSIRSQMQTRRSEPTTSNAYVHIRPSTILSPAALVDSLPSSSKPVQQQQQQQRAGAQPQLVPIVGSSRSSSVTQWSSVRADKQADQMTSGGGKNLPAVTVGSLNSPTSGAIASALESNDRNSLEKNDSRTSSSLNRAARTPQSARMAEERANNSDAWLVPAGFDQQSLIRDYEVLAAQQERQQQHQPPPVDGLAAATTAPSASKPHDETRGDQSGGHLSRQQDDELLQVASSMRANLIHLGDGGRAASAGGDRPQPTVAVAGGAEYQLDTVDGGQQEAVAGGEIEENNLFDDKRQGALGNKLIEAKTNTNTNTNNAAIVVADGGKPASAQHDKRHRSHSLSMSSQQHRAAPKTTTTDGAGGGDNVLVELPASISTLHQRQEQVTPPPATTTMATTTTVDQQTLSSQELSQVAGSETKHPHHRAFRGIVAGGLGGAGAR